MMEIYDLGWIYRNIYNMIIRKIDIVMIMYRMVMIMYRMVMIMYRMVMIDIFI